MKRMSIGMGLGMGVWVLHFTAIGSSQLHRRRNSDHSGDGVESHDVLPENEIWREVVVRYNASTKCVNVVLRKRK